MSPDPAPPDSPDPLLHAIASGAGFLAADTVSDLLDELGVDAHELALRALPHAERLAIAPISDFSVGAVAYSLASGARSCALYLGANLEFPGQSLGFSVHAEQSAVHNAWRNGEPAVTHVAVSAPPCGHCRQFLLELPTASSLTIPSRRSADRPWANMPLTELIPHAFGPADLGRAATLMSGSPRPLGLVEAVTDSLVRVALEAASRSHAPYTGALAGAAVETSDGRQFPGLYAESAAYNPSLAPLSGALAGAALAASPGRGLRIRRAVLVEVAGRVSQRDGSATVLQSVAPGVDLEVHTAQEA